MFVEQLARLHVVKDKLCFVVVSTEGASTENGGEYVRGYGFCFVAGEWDLSQREKSEADGEQPTERRHCIMMIMMMMMMMMIRWRR